MKNPKLEPTILERALSHVAPKTAQRLYQRRASFELAAYVGRGIGGYIGARRDRAATADWNPGGGSATADIIPDLPMLRDRSRDQMRNAPVASGGLQSDVLHVVGTGLSYTPAIDHEVLGISEDRARAWEKDTKRRFKAWAASKDCHLQRQLDFYSIQELGYRSWLESGDVLVLTPVVQRGGQDTLALQLIEADRVSTPMGNTAANIIDGVEVSEFGEPIAVHVAKYHPGDFKAGGNTWQRYEIRGEGDRLNVLHLLDCLRPGQVRGVPWIAPILEPLRQLSKWTDSELNAAVVSSMWVVFTEMDHEAFDDLFEDKEKATIVNNALKWSGKVESGKAINLLPGEKAEMQTPGRPNPQFDPFFQSMVAQMGVALGVPKEVLMMNFQSSYTAARAAFIVAWRRWRQRRDKIAKELCAPVLDLWLAMEVRAGRVACPGFFARKDIRAAWCEAMWTGDGPGSVDPVKEVTAAKMRVDMGISTLQDESIQYDGQDWEGKQRQRAKEVEAQRKDGTLAEPPAAAPGTPLPQPQPQQGGGSDDDTEGKPASVRVAA